MVDLGTEISSEWVLTENGDLKLVYYKDNLIQAVKNRLTSNLNNLSLFYEDYGSILTGFIGWKKNNTTLEFIKIEIGNRLRNEPRIKSFDISAEYGDDGNVILDLDLILADGETVEFNLVLE